MTSKGESYLLEQKLSLARSWHALSAQGVTVPRDGCAVDVCSTLLRTLWRLTTEAPFLRLRNFLDNQSFAAIFEKTKKIQAQDVDEVC